MPCPSRSRAQFLQYPIVETPRPRRWDAIAERHKVVYRDTPMRWLHLAESHEVACLIITTLHLRSCAGVARCPTTTACQRCAPRYTTPCATGAYLWHALLIYIENPAQLRKCRAMIRLAALQQPPRSTADTPRSACDANCADDDQRRCNSPPREGLQPCVAPYFADRGVGDMRGPPNSTPKSPHQS